MHSTHRYDTPAQLRAAVRSRAITSPTPGQCPGYVQANLVIVAAAVADDFEAFCRRNAQPCPLLERTAPGDPEPKQVAPGADLRTDVPRYRVWIDGRAETVEPSDIRDRWRDDAVGFLLGCSFTFENALQRAGLDVRHVSEGRNVPMYRTQVACQPAGPFRGNLVVSMRPYRLDQVDEVRKITARYPQMHGAPVHVGDPSALGIVDLARPEFGQAVTIRADEVPVFWACGVTPQLALEQARLDWAITRSPGYMFLTDLRDEQFCTT